MVINVNERMNECRLYFSFCISVVLEPTSRFFFSHSGCILLIFLLYSSVSLPSLLFFTLHVLVYFFSFVFFEDA